jgi:hypothetical protein
MAARIGGLLALKDDRSAVRHDQPIPDQQHPRLTPRCILALKSSSSMDPPRPWVVRIGPAEASTMRHQFDVKSRLRPSVCAPSSPKPVSTRLRRTVRTPCREMIQDLRPATGRADGARGRERSSVLQSREVHPDFRVRN